MRKTIRSTIAAAMASAALAATALGVGSASAAPYVAQVGDATTTAVPSGTKVTITAFNNIPAATAPIACGWFIFRDDDVDRSSSVEFSQATPLLNPGESYAATSAALQPGKYVLDWYCYAEVVVDADGNLTGFYAWGTPRWTENAVGEAGATPFPTPEIPFTIAEPTPDPEPEPESTCFGSVCLP